MAISIQDKATRRILIISQTFPPDPASVGQHLADAAVELANRGHHITVFTSNRGYEDPHTKYPSKEVRDGVQIYRFPFSSFGKRSMSIRLCGAVGFLLQCLAWGLLTRKMDGILVSTSPPMAAVAAVLIARIRSLPVVYWAMDINPDQAVALGQVRPKAKRVRIFNWFNRFVLRNSTRVITLDRFMAERLAAKQQILERLHVLPPWPHEDHLEDLPHDRNPFRKQHGLDGKMVVMYSGNMSVASPLTTLLAAAERLRDRQDIAFLFIGGGNGKVEVEEFIRKHGPKNVKLLPYQPIERIRYSLSAADLHVVTVGDRIVGICHPCKVYGAMAVARPILLIGPNPCHVSEIIAEQKVGWHVAHGDVDGAVAAIEESLAIGPDERAEMGRIARQVIQERFTKAELCEQFCEIVEEVFASQPFGIREVTRTGG